MPLPDRLLPAALFALALAGCGGAKGDKLPRPHLAVAPSYEVRDDAQVRRLHEYQTQLALAGGDLQAGHLASAEKRARAASRLFPERVDAMMLLAAVASQRGESGQAGQWLQRAAERAPERGDVLNNYGAWLCQNGRASEALPWLDRAMLAPGYSSPEVAQSNAGACALQLGQRERAERDLRAALQRNPSDMQALESMARLSYEQGAFMDARAFAERRLAAAPATVSMLQLASQIETRLGDQRAAERYMQRIRQEFPQDAGTNSKG